MKHREFIAENVPEVDTPEVFGLHANADITYRLRNAATVLGTILDIQPRQSGGGGGLSREEQVVILADDLLKKMPQPWNKDHVKECMQKIGHRQPLNIFASQEVDRLQVCEGRWVVVVSPPPPPPAPRFQYSLVFLCLLLSFNICTTALNAQVSCCDDQGRLV